jgi:hypothetical protein
VRYLTTHSKRFQYYFAKISDRVLTLSARLGEAERTEDQRKHVRVTYPFGSDPIAKYKFRYRSLGKSIIDIIMNVAKRQYTDIS